MNGDPSIYMKIAIVVFAVVVLVFFVVAVVIESNTNSMCISLGFDHGTVQFEKGKVYQYCYNDYDRVPLEEAEATHKH